MKKNRYLLCLLACGFMLYFAVPRMSISVNSEQGVFSLAWLLFALIVVAGNLTGLLYSPKRQKQLQTKALKQKHLKGSRSFHR